MAALVQDFQLEQGADWPGWAFHIVDAAGNPKTLTSGMVGSGYIGPTGGPAIFTWSTAPAAGQGLITLVGTTFTPTVTAAQTRLWGWSNMPYQLYLFDPAAPVGSQTIRVARGTIYLDRTNGP